MEWNYALSDIMELEMGVDLLKSVVDAVKNASLNIYLHSLMSFLVNK